MRTPLVKPHYVLHFHWFDGKTPLWWVTAKGCIGDTGGYTTARGACFRAAVKTWILG